jgi:hypothetical protein
MVCASVNTQGGTSPAGLTEALLQRAGMAIIIDEVRHQSPWSFHKNKKQALGKRHDASSIEFPSDGLGRIDAAGGGCRRIAAFARRG